MKYPMSTIIADGSPTEMFKRLGFDPTLISVLDVTDNDDPTIYITNNLDRIRHIKIASNMSRYYKNDVMRPYEETFNNLAEWMVFSGMKDLYGFIRNYHDVCVRHYLFPNGTPVSHPYSKICMSPVPTPYILHAIHETIHDRVGQYYDIPSLVNNAILSHPNIYPILYHPFRDAERHLGTDSLIATYKRIVASDEDIDGFAKFMVELQVIAKQEVAMKIDDINIIHEFNKEETKNIVGYMTYAMLIGANDPFIVDNIFIGRYHRPNVTFRIGEKGDILYRIEFNIKPELRWGDHNDMASKVSELMAQDQSLPSFSDRCSQDLSTGFILDDRISKVVTSNDSTESKE